MSGSVDGVLAARNGGQPEDSVLIAVKFAVTPAPLGAVGQQSGPVQLGQCVLDDRVTRPLRGEPVIDDGAPGALQRADGRRRVQ